jgi:hypothetical protein
LLALTLPAEFPAPVRKARYLFPSDTLDRKALPG